MHASHPVECFRWLLNWYRNILHSSKIHECEKSQCCFSPCLWCWTADCLICAGFSRSSVRWAEKSPPENSTTHHRYPAKTRLVGLYLAENSRAALTCHQQPPPACLMQNQKQKFCSGENLNVFFCDYTIMSEGAPLTTSMPEWLSPSPRHMQCKKLLKWV